MIWVIILTGNDVIVLNSILNQKKQQVAETLPDDDFFELFVFEQILKDFDLSYDDYFSGKVSCSSDGGIDGFFFFINNELINESPDVEAIKRNPELSLYLIQVKRSNSFSEGPIDKLYITVSRMFNLRIKVEDMIKDFNPNLIEKIKLFREAYLNLASKHPKLKLRIYYVSKGSTSNINIALKNKAEQIEKTIKEKLYNSNSEFKFLGARELLDLSRIEKTYTLPLNFIENYLSKGDDNYIVLSSLFEYYKFVKDEGGNLRYYIFESNVRDYQGNVEVNKDIQKTLETEDELDFWWLNNGITVLASKASIVGKTITLDNVQIVNGLQTTMCIFNYINNLGEANIDPRIINMSILIRIIITNEPAARDRIIKATNFQTAISPASLRATDSFQRDLEDYFKQHEWFYDRRKNYYKNSGKPVMKIISIPFLAQSIMSIILKEPNNARARPTSLIKRDADYSRIFNTSLTPDIYLFSAKTARNIESYLKSEMTEYSYSEKSNLKFHITMVAIMKLSNKRNYGISDIKKLLNNDVPKEIIRQSSIETIELANRFADENQVSIEVAAKSKDFLNFLKENIEVNS